MNKNSGLIPHYLCCKLMLAALLSSNSYGLAQERHLSVDVSQSVAKISPTMYGIFFEDINFAADGGLYPELVKNRSFEFDDPLLGWEQPNSTRYAFSTGSGLATVLEIYGK